MFMFLVRALEVGLWFLPGKGGWNIRGFEIKVYKCIYTGNTHIRTCTYPRIHTHRAHVSLSYTDMAC